jgi:hypothetical protein
VNGLTVFVTEVSSFPAQRAHMARQAHVREDLYSKLHAALMELEHKHARTTAAVREVQERFELGTKVLAQALPLYFPAEQYSMQSESGQLLSSKRSVIRCR